MALRRINVLNQIPENRRGVVRLAQRLQVPLELRTWKRYTFNGDTIALFDDHNNFLLPCEILHEVCHHIMAEPWLRDVPEWGMLQGLVGWHPPLSDNDEALQVGEGLLDPEEQHFQEALTQWGVVALAPFAGISVIDFSYNRYSPDKSLSLETYIRVKTEEWNKDFQDLDLWRRAEIESNQRIQKYIRELETFEGLTA